MKKTNRGRPAEPESLASIAKKLTQKLGFAVTIKSVRVWKEKGYPLNEPEKLLDCLAGQQRAGNLEPKTISEAKLEKLLVDIQAAKFRLEVQRGQYTHNDLLADQGRRIGAATRGELLRFKADAPTWEGLSAVEIDRRVSTLIETICKNLNDSLGNAYRK